MANERRSQGCFCQKYVDSISKIARLEEDVARLKRENADLRKQLGRIRGRERRRTPLARRASSTRALDARAWLRLRDESARPRPQVRARTA